jgi:hypothetical protein
MPPGSLRRLMLAEWERKSDGTRWRVKEFREGTGEQDGVIMQRVRLVSEPYSEADLSSPPPEMALPGLAAVWDGFLLLYDVPKVAT